MPVTSDESLAFCSDPGCISLLFPPREDSDGPWAERSLNCAEVFFGVNLSLLQANV